MNWVLFFVLSVTSLTASADTTYRCTTVDGRSTYQQKPCGPGVTSTKVEITETRLTDDAKVEAAKNAARLRQLHEAFQARLRAGDLDGARALAVTAEDFREVDEAVERKRKTEEASREKHAAECAERGAELEQLQHQKTLHPEDNALRNSVSDAQSRFDASCR